MPKLINATENMQIIIFAHIRCDINTMDQRMQERKNIVMNHCEPL